MRSLANLTTALTMLLTLLVSAPTPRQAQLEKPTLPKTPPDLVLKVEHQSGTCPNTVGIWSAFHSYEGGGEHTVIADIVAFAGDAQLTSSGEKLVEYRAPLKTAYASCIGWARDENNGQDLYRFLFRDGNVYFRVELPPDTLANPSIFSTVSFLDARPYVRWAIAD